MLNLKTKIIILCLAMVSRPGFALQTLDDLSLSKATGQDGLTITLKDFSPNAQIIWTDTNGINATDGINPIDIGLITAVSETGSVVFGDGTTSGNFRISTGTTTITVDADGGVGAPFVNVAIDLPDDMTINTGNVYVAGKDSNNNLIHQTQIMKDMTIRLSGLNMNLQLGNSPQGGLVKVFGVINTGLHIENIALLDNAVQNIGIGISKMTIKDNGVSPNLTFNGLSIDVIPAGLKITPSAGKVVDVLMQDFRVGDLSSSSSSLGSMALVGLQLDGNSLVIAGH